MADIHVIISTHQGVIYDEHCDFVVVMDKKGEFGMLKNHINLITTIMDGFLKLKRDNEELFVAIADGALIFNNNELNVVCAEAIVGKTKERAKELLLETRNERLDQNRKINTEFELVERELRDSIKEAKAGRL